MIHYFLPSITTPEDAEETKQDGAIVGLLYAAVLVGFIAFDWIIVGTNQRLSPEAIAGARETISKALWLPVVFAALSLRILTAPSRVAAWWFLTLSVVETAVWIASGPEIYAFIFMRIPVILAAVNAVRGAHACKRLADARALKALF